ncbi:MAG: hypothetical protein ABFS19_02925 [Thermodesulfobacteriota bacterium]
MKPVLAVAVVIFPLSTFTSHWYAKLVLPSIAAGALIVFTGIYLYRRQLSIRRMKNVKDSVFHYEIDELGIHFKNELASGVLKWGFKGKLITLKEFILLQSNEIGFIPLPLDTPDDALILIKNKLLVKKQSR